MNINSFLDNQGMMTVPNPLYNPKSKKNKQPATIQVPDDGSQTPTAVNLAITDITNQHSGFKEDVKKYADYGLTWWEHNKIKLDSQLADAQSNWEKAYHALGQTLISEIGAGTVQGFVDIFDFVANKIMFNEEDYQSDASKAIQEWRDKYDNEVAPIYVDPNVDIQNGGFGNFGWWMKNIPQIASTLTLLIPAKSISSAVTVAGKAAGIGKTIGKARRWASRMDKVQDGAELNKLQTAINSPLGIAKANYAAQTLGEGLLMRTAENMQEARETHIQTYQLASEKLNCMSDEEYNTWLTYNNSLKEEFQEKGIDINNRNEVAKAIAKNAADRTFAMDFSNLIFDVIQLHSLNNIGKGVKKATGRKIQELQRASIDEAESLATGVTKEAVKQPFYKKAGNLVWDFAKYNAKEIAAESTEGVEEAINYIAQQEGLTYGQMLLDGTAESYNYGVVPGIFQSWNHLQGNLKDYLNTAELQESAFWGVLGGVVFGYAGNIANRTSLALNRKAAEKARKENPITGESVDLKDESGNDWLSLFEVSEQRAAREGINRRKTRLNQLSQDLKLINQNKDIFGKKNEDGSFKEFTGDTTKQQELARQEAIDNFIFDMTMDAVNSGTDDLLIEYLQNKTVKNAMAQLGITTEDEANNFGDKAAQAVKNIRDLSARQSAFVLNQIAVINGSKNEKETIPLEYAQIIANENVRAIWNRTNIDNKISNLELKAGEQIDIDKELGETQNIGGAREAVKFATLIDLYTRLSADEKALNEVDFTESLARLNQQEDLKRIKKSKEAVIDALKTMTLNGNAVGLSAIYQAVKRSSGVVKDATGAYVIDTNASELTDEEILKQAKDIFNGDTSNMSDESVIQLAKRIEGDINSVVRKNGLADSNRKLFEIYADLAYLETKRLMSSASIYKTLPQIKDRVDFYHNHFNEARVKMITKAEEIIRNAYSQYDGVTENGQHIEEAIIAAYNGNKQEARRIAEKYMSDDKSRGLVTASEFIDALDVFNLSSATNEAMYYWIRQMLNKVKRSKQQTTPIDTTEAPGQNQNTTGNQNGNNGQQNAGSNNLSSDQSQSGRTQQNRQNGRVKRNIKIITNSKGQIVSIKNDSTGKNYIEGYVNPDGTIELNIADSPRNIALKYYNTELLNVDSDVEMLSDHSDWFVSENPILKKVGKGYKVISPGVISRTEQASSPVEETQTDDEILAATEEAEAEEGETTPEIKAEESFDFSSVALNNDNIVDESNNSSTGEVKSKTDKIQEVPTLPPMGGQVESNPIDLLSEAPEPIKLDEPVVEKQNSLLKNEANIDDIRQDISLVFGKHIPNGNLLAENLDVEDVANKVREDLKGKADTVGLTEEQLEELIEERKNIIKNAVTLIRNCQSGLAKAGIATAYAAKYEEADNTDYSKLFTNTIEQFMQEYKKILVCPVVDGKQVVSLEDVLRICNNVYPTSDTSVAQSMYNVIRSYLLSEEGKSKYIVTDLNKGDSILKNINKTNKELKSERADEYTAQRVDINSFLESLSNNDESVAKEALKVLENIKKGDKLQLINANDELVFVKDGVAIGRMPKPKLVGNSYVVVNEGWVTDVSLDANGNPVSSLKPIFLDIFTSDNADADALRQLFIKLRPNEKINDATIKAFENNPIIKKLYAEAREDVKTRKNKIFVDYKTGKIDSEKVLSHLVKLWHYTNLSSNSWEKADNIRNIKDNLDIWFFSRYKGYDTVYNINENSEVEVVKFNDGMIVKADNSKHPSYSNLQSPSEAASDINNMFISIVDETNPTIINIAGKPSRSETGYHTNNTFVTIYGNDGNAYYAKAYGTRLNDNNPKALSQRTKTIGSAAYNALTNVCNSFVRDLAIGKKNTSDLERIIASIVRVKGYNNMLPLLAPTAGAIEIVKFNNNNGEGIKINYYANGYRRNIWIYTRINFAENEPRGISKILIADEYNDVNGQKINKIVDSITVREKEGFMIGGKLFNALLPFTQINIDRQGIESDSFDNKEFGGFLNKKNGKLELKVPIAPGKFYTETFDSYNDMLVKGDMIKVNLKKDENGSNFTRRGDDQRLNQQLLVSLPVKPKPTTKTKSGNEYVKTTTIKEDFDKVKELATNNKTDFGLSLFSEILGQEEFDKFKQTVDNNQVKLEDILPSRVVYDSLLNDMFDKVELGAYAYSSGDPNGKYRSYPRMINGKKVEGYKIPSNENLVIGSRLLNLAASKQISKRKEAIRKLIHEQIHIKLQGNPAARAKVLTELNSIYDEFDKHIKEDLSKLDKNSKVYDTLNKLHKTFTSYRGERRLEEFMVESLTNEDMFNYLNSIKVDVKYNGKPENLFTRIAKIIADFFGWTINDDSLYMKELNAIRNALSGETTEVEVEEESKKEQPKKELKEEKQEPTESEQKEEQKPKEEGDDTFSSEDIDEMDALLEEDDIEDYDEYDEYDDDDASASLLGEDNVDFDGFIQSNNLDAVREKLPLELQSSYDALSRDGFIETKCH